MYSHSSCWRPPWAASFFCSPGGNARRSQYGPSGLSEFRTDLPLDDCFDRLDQHSPDDEFAYECRRENDGGSCST